MSIAPEIPKITEMVAGESPRCCPHSGMATCRVARTALTTRTPMPRVDSTERCSLITVANAAVDGASGHFSSNAG